MCFFCFVVAVVAAVGVGVLSFRNNVTFYFKRCIIAALARPAFSIVCSASVSSLLGNVVKRANVWAAYCGLALIE